VKVPGLSGIVAISAGGSHSVALKSDGTVWTWGYNTDGELGDGTTTQRISPVQVPAFSGVVAVAAGNGHTMALKGDGSVWVWGSNGFYQLGDGGASYSRTSAYQLPGVSNVVAIAAGYYHSLALKGDGTAWSWGYNGSGQLGDGTTQFRSSPVQVSGSSGMVNIAGGGLHSLAVKGDGTLWAWGDNFSGEVGDGTTINRTTPVRVNLNLDTVAPTTTASPVGGTYPSTQTVTLTANEAATIYYTLDGSTPTTASAVYAGPLVISSTKTLRYFAKDLAGNSEAVKSQTYIISPLVAPTADFSAATTIGNAPFQVVFSDLSTGAPTSWLWNFGDGLTSTQQNPVHSYLTPGTFTVSLTATNAGGSGLTSKSNYITAIASGTDSLQLAYSSALDGGNIRLWAGDLTESPLFNRNIAVKISGGYDYFRQQLLGITTIHGKITITNGKAIMENLVIK